MRRGPDPVEIPRVTPVGILEVPERYATSPRTYPGILRLAATLLLAAFAAVSIVTTVYSLGAYCLTSDASTPFAFGP